MKEINNYSSFNWLHRGSPSPNDFIPQPYNEYIMFKEHKQDNERDSILRGYMQSFQRPAIILGSYLIQDLGPHSITESNNEYIKE